MDQKDSHLQSAEVPEKAEVQEAEQILEQKTQGDIVTERRGFHH